MSQSGKSTSNLLSAKSSAGGKSRVSFRSEFTPPAPPDTVVTPPPPAPENAAATLLQESLVTITGPDPIVSSLANSVEEIATIKSRPHSATLTSEAALELERQELAKSSGMRRKTILLDLKDPDAPLSRLVGGEDGEEAMEREAALGANTAGMEGRTGAGGDAARSALLSPEMGVPSSMGMKKKSNVALNGSNANLGSAGRQHMSVSFLDQQQGRKSGSTMLTPPSDGKHGLVAGGGGGAGGGSSSRLFGSGLGLSAGLLVHPGGGSAVNLRLGSAPVVNAKIPAGPNPEVLARARALCHDRNADVNAMVGTYDPWPLFWPTVKEEKEERTKKGRQMKDEWERNAMIRFKRPGKVSCFISTIRGF
ncbi:hypothetical protein HDU98_006040 [Podochytrium sp. JEL0797]|nr:hypothetical protein HDU98_006040 [Podochytrium sp. JEL0797]